MTKKVSARRSPGNNFERYGVSFIITDPVEVLRRIERDHARTGDEAIDFAQRISRAARHLQAIQGSLRAAGRGGAFAESIDRAVSQLGEAWSMLSIDNPLADVEAARRAPKDMLLRSQIETLHDMGLGTSAIVAAFKTAYADRPGRRGISQAAIRAQRMRAQKKDRHTWLTDFARYAMLESIGVVERFARAESAPERSTARVIAMVDHAPKLPARRKR